MNLLTRHDMTKKLLSLFLVPTSVMTDAFIRMNDWTGWTDLVRLIHSIYSSLMNTRPGDHAIVAHVQSVHF